jgi:glucokinase
MQVLILAGDIGATKSSVAIFSSPQDIGKPILEKTYINAKYDNLEGLLKEFLSKIKHPIEKASFGVAGPVVNGRAALTNLDWVIDEKRLQEVLGIPSVHLLNDLTATAAYIPFLKSSDFKALHRGKPATHGTIGVIAPGTGLGEAFLTWDGSKYRPLPSQGGHCDFAPTNPAQVELYRYLNGRLGHVSYERVCSGIGLKDIYSFYHNFVGINEEHKKIASAIEGAEDPTPIIVAAALSEKHCELCVKTVGTFVSALGAEASNLALKVLATNGIYVAGGMPVHLRSALEDGRFLDAFRNKGRMTSLISDIPIYLVLNPKIALFGAAKQGFDVLEAAIIR